jgi:hypothetical protein
MEFNLRVLTAALCAGSAGSMRGYVPRVLTPVLYRAHARCWFYYTANKRRGQALGPPRRAENAMLFDARGIAAEILAYARLERRARRR